MLAVNPNLSEKKIKAIITKAYSSINDPALDA